MTSPLSPPALLNGNNFVKAMRLKTTKADEKDLRGTVTLFLFGSSINDRVAFMDIEDAYKFEVFARRDFYKLLTNIDAREAYKAALEFLSQDILYQGSFLNKIITELGNVIGYEVYPSYCITSHSPDELPQTSYKLSDRTVTVYITAGLSSRG